MIVASSPYLDGTQPGKYCVEIKRGLSSTAAAMQVERARLEKLEEVAKMDTWEDLVCALSHSAPPTHPLSPSALGEAGRGEGFAVCQPPSTRMRFGRFVTRLVGSAVGVLQHTSS